MLLVSGSRERGGTDRHKHAEGMTTLRQAMDDYLVALGPLSSDLAEWLQIWAKPLCKSTFLKPNQQTTAPPHPTTQPPTLSTSSNHSSPANNALQNQHQAQRETKEVRHHREQEGHELLGIFSALFPIHIQYNAC